jgi:hypothetical protein
MAPLEPQTSQEYRRLRESTLVDARDANGQFTVNQSSTVAQAPSDLAANLTAAEVRCVHVRIG